MLPRPQLPTNRTARNLTEPAERAFGLGACVLTEAVQLVGEHLEAA
jgi:hypothetical protein